MEVCGLDGQDYIKLPNVFTHPDIPAKKTNIPQKKDLEKWSYLNRVHLPKLESEIGLLIGANAHKAMEPWEIINSRNDGPYAVKTALGWVVNGPVSRCQEKESDERQSFLVNRISVQSIEDMLIRHYDADFPERRCEDKQEPSQHDKQFMHTVRTSAYLTDWPDCAATYQGVSLNDRLLQGPDLTNTLVGVLLRFRQEPVALMADIESMFYQVRIPDEDADLLCFLWWPGGNLNEPVEEYRMCVHLFGATSSPSCASYALRRTAQDAAATTSPEATQTNNFYVDDCLRSVATEKGAVNLVKELTELCARGGFHLTKWVSNSTALLCSIPGDERAAEVKDLDLQQDELPVERALGVQWCTSSFVLYVI